jgi:hypothetical protein
LTGDLPDCAARLAELAVELSPATAPQARAVLRRVDLLREQQQLQQTLERARTAAESGTPSEALELLDGLPERPRRDVRVVRQRALVLLRLGRFEEADAAAASATGDDPLTRELRERWPALHFKHRLAAAHRALRAGELDTADEILTGATPPTPDDELQLGHALAFACALRAQEAEKRGDLDGSARAIARGLDLVEPLRELARKRSQADLLSLADELERRAGVLERAKNERSRGQ